jgi:hypothetical protein
MARDRATRRTFRLVQVTATVAAATIALAACAGSSIKSATVAGTTSGSTSAAVSVATSGVKIAPPLGNSTSKFCQVAQQAQAQTTQQEQQFSTDTPAELQKFEEQAMAALTLYAAQAPTQIKGALQTILAAEQTLFNDMKASGYDITKMTANDLSAFETPAFVTAVTTVTNYLATTCGITTSAAPTS